jgi:hypothetical protein
MRLPSRQAEDDNMPLSYQVNLINYERWVSTGYQRGFSWGLVLDGTAKELGFWRVVRYNPNLDTEGGCYEFSLQKTGPAIVSEEFSFLDSQVSRGIALANFVAKISDWLKEQ